jgi:hypothetical protein
MEQTITLLAAAVAAAMAEEMEQTIPEMAV